MLDAPQLRQIMPNVPAAKVSKFLPHLNDAMAQYGITSAARASAFLAQLAHESGEFRWMEEIWGPTTAQRRYEPVTELAKRLGNVQPGDGRRYKGRGPIQLTGRANYQRFGQLLGIDLVAEPERAASPAVAFRIAGLYWANRGLNALADAGDFREITRRINGGFNGLADRLKYFERARAALGEAIAKALPRRRRAAPSQAAVPEEPLSRGVEEIREYTAARRRKARTARKAVPRAAEPVTRKKKTATKAKTKAKTAAKPRRTVALAKRKSPRSRT